MTELDKTVPQELIGGTIEFINEKGKGTQYIIKLKQKVVSEERIGNITDKIQTKSATKRLRLFFVNYIFHLNNFINILKTAIEILLSF